MIKLSDELGRDEVIKIICGFGRGRSNREVRVYNWFTCKICFSVGWDEDHSGVITIQVRSNLKQELSPKRGMEHK